MNILNKIREWTSIVLNPPRILMPDDHAKHLEEIVRQIDRSREGMNCSYAIPQATTTGTSMNTANWYNAEFEAYCRRFQENARLNRSRREQEAGINAQMLAAGLRSRDAVQHDWMYMGRWDNANGNEYRGIPYREDVSDADPEVV